MRGVQGAGTGGAESSGAALEAVAQPCRDGHRVDKHGDRAAAAAGSS